MSLNFESYRTDTSVLLPASSDLTSGLTKIPLTLYRGGTTSTVNAFCDVFYSSSTTSLNSSSGKQGSSIFDLSEVIGHLETLH